MVECDIIIPIYNAYEYVKKCAESVLKNTMLGKAKLILVDDKSPDKRIVPLLEKIARENPDKVVLIKNEENLGFVGTVNKGMKFSDKDVVLLNSDTEVPEGWLERMKKCAYSDERIATVTPLSNNATLASVPKFDRENQLPKGYSLAKMDEVVKKCSMKLYPEIPSAVGFCMYIKREALNEVGYFDEENFGKGYGEENDFCFRCIEAGWVNVLDDDVYVLHKGTQSFLGEKELHGDALRKKHPEIMANVDKWYARRDIEKIADNVALFMGGLEKKQNILLVSDDENVEKFETTIDKLRQKYNLHVLAIGQGNMKVKSFFKDTEVVTGIYELPMSVAREVQYTRAYEKMLQEIVKIYKIGLIWNNDKKYGLGTKNVCKDMNVDYAEDASVDKIEQKCEKLKKEEIDILKVRKSMLEYDFVRNVSDSGELNERLMASELRVTELTENLKKTWMRRLASNPYSKTGEMIRVSKKWVDKNIRKMKGNV